MRKKLIFVILFVLVSIFIVSEVRQYNTLSKMGNILSTIASDDKVIVKDVEKEEIIMTLTDEDERFEGARDVYTLYHPLSWREKKLLKNDPIYEVIYLVDDENQFSAYFHQVDEKDIPLVREDFDTINGPYPFKYSPTESDNTFVLAIDDLDHIVIFTDEIESLLTLLVQ